MKVRAAGQRSATAPKPPRGSTPQRRKRRRQPAPQITTVRPVIAGPSGVATMASTISPAAMVQSTAARVWARLVSLPVAIRRVQDATTPIEPVPVSWTQVPVMSPDARRGVMGPDGSALLARPIELAKPAPVPELEAVSQLVAASSASLLAASRVPAGRATKAPVARSIKNGPPKAPRTRRAAQDASAQVSLPEVIVPVMVADSAPLDTAAVEAAPSVLTDVVPIVAPTPHPQAPDKRPVIDPGHAVGVERARSTLAQRIGDDAERVAAIRLEALGWRIIARNLRVSRTEIDLLAIDPGDPPTLVVVEVRRRNRRDFGLAEETVDHRKRAALRRAAGELAMRSALPDGRRLPDLPVRVDLIAIDRGPDGRPTLRHHRGIDT